MFLEITLRCVSSLTTAGPLRDKASTTNDFLENFGLNRVSDLPKLKEVSELTDQDMLDKMKLDSLQLNQSENSNDISTDNLSVTNLLP